MIYRNKQHTQKENTMTMTIEQMKAAIEKAESDNRKQADKLKATRDKARASAEAAHKEYVDFCRENNVPLAKGRPVGSKNKPKEVAEEVDKESKD